VLELQFGTRLPVKGQALVLAHLDTVWPMGTLERMPWREADGKLFGPGVLDIKAGIVMTLEAIAAVQKLGRLNRRVTLLLVSEEEIGSPVSRPITERLAGRSAEVFVVEPAQGLAYKTARKGVGHYELHVAGVAAHSGVDFERGHSAIREMARLVEEVSGFTDLSKGRTLNVGVIQGGTRSNVVAAECRAEVDVRVVRARDVAAVERMFKKLKVADRKCRLSVSGGINRPPMERKPGTVKLFQQAREFAAELGVVLEEAATGGGSDGNFTAALGVPTLDGMGAVGAGAHADHEHVVKKHLVERATLLAAMMAGPDQSRSRRTVAATGRPTTLK
jgi:glutamate carboxypeptidase